MRREGVSAATRPLDVCPPAGRASRLIYHPPGAPRADRFDDPVTSRMPRVLSSAQTFFMKLVFPPLWSVLFGWLMLAGRGHPAGTYPSMPIPLLVWCAGMAAMLWMCVPLKRVSMDGKNLYISNYFREITVPLAAIGEVTENRWINIHPVTIHFRRPTEFGQRITFMPTARLFANWSSHPVVEELRRAAASQKR